MRRRNSGYNIVQRFTGLFKYELIVFRKGLEVLVSIKVEIEALTFGTELGEERNSTWGEENLLRGDDWF